MAEGLATDDSRPLPLRVRDHIRDLVRDSALQPGDQLPGESELATRLGVSRPTVREALKLLEQDGVVRSRQGRGRFLTASVTFDRPLTRLEGVTDMLATRGYSPVNRVLGVEVDFATGEETAGLRLEPDVPVVRLERARTHDGDLLVYSVDVIPRRIVPGRVEDVDWTASLYATLEAAGTRVASASAHVEARTLDPRTAERLDVAPGEPWLVLRQEHYDDEDTPLILSVDYHRSDRFTFHVTRRRDG